MIIERLKAIINNVLCFIKADIYLTQLILNIYKNKVTIKPNNKTVLPVIICFLCSFKYLYGNKIVMNRRIDESIRLITSLVNSYLETESDTTLDQIFQVLKTEFIKRSK